VEIKKGGATAAFQYFRFKFSTPEGYVQGLRHIYSDIRVTASPIVLSSMLRIETLSS